MPRTGTAADGFTITRDWQPDVLICDIALPDPDRCTFLTELRSREERAKTIPALALTVPAEQARITAVSMQTDSLVVAVAETMHRQTAMIPHDSRKLRPA